MSEEYAGGHWIQEDAHASEPLALPFEEFSLRAAGRLCAHDPDQREDELQMALPDR